LTVALLIQPPEFYGGLPQVKIYLKSAVKASFFEATTYPVSIDWGHHIYGQKRPVAPAPGFGPSGGPFSLS